MRVGFVGLGKLGLPCAVATALKGHEVYGYDVNPAQMSKSDRPYLETGPDGMAPFNPFLRDSSIQFVDLETMVDICEIVIVAVQTPHDSLYEGVTRIPETRVDFDYSHLIQAVESLSAVARTDLCLAVVSTVLPGTMRRHIRSRLSRHLKLCYTPSFIAMGTTMRDFLSPEFVLLGVDDTDAANAAERFFRSFISADVYRTSVENAELIKVAYNTFLGMKIAFANTMMEICEKTPGADVNGVMGAIKMARQRLISPLYLDGGMGDGGGCHPRDNIAMSWLARSLPLSHDIFENIMIARENQTAWLADLMEEYDLPKAILGYSYKPETNITVGSPALLLKAMLEERGHEVKMSDPIVEDQATDLSSDAPHVYLIGSRHDEFAGVRFPPGSVVLDPWRYLADPGPGVTLRSIGG